MKLTFNNGMSISIQQEVLTYSTAGETCEVAVFYPDGAWYDLDGLGNDTSVSGHLNANKLAELLVEISEIKTKAED